MLVFEKLLAAASAADALLPRRPPPPLSDEDGDTFVDAVDAHLSEDAHDDGGMACKDLSLLEKQRSAILDIMKTFSKNLLTGHFDLLKISFPVKLFEPRSYLQKLADPFVHAHFLSSAAATTNDPILRMKYVIAFNVAGAHLSMPVWCKPFNPILGETWQAHLPDDGGGLGASLFIEQVSHHPPITAFQMFGPKGAYYFHGKSQVAVSYRTNAVRTSTKGYRRVEFSDGGAIDMIACPPPCHIKGLMYTGAPRAMLQGSAEFIDAQNGLRAVVHFGGDAVAEGGSGGGEGGRNNPLLARPDAVSGTMYSTCTSRVQCGTNGSSNGSVAGTEENGTTEEQDLGWKQRATVLSNTTNTDTTTSLAPVGANGGIQRSKSSYAVSGFLGNTRGFLAKTMSTVRRTSSSAGLGGREGGGGGGGDGRQSHVANEAKIPVAHCSGNWLAYLDWDGTRFWTMNEEDQAVCGGCDSGRKKEWIPDPNPLPSDARYRPDMAALAAGDMQEAQAAKDRLENLQRTDAKLRKLALS